MRCSCVRFPESRDLVNSASSAKPSQWAIGPLGIAQTDEALLTLQTEHWWRPPTQSAQSHGSSSLGRLCRPAHCGWNGRLQGPSPGEKKE